MEHTAADLAANPLWNLPKDDPNCINGSCLAYIYGWFDEQERYSNDYYPQYAEWTVYFYCATIIVFATVYSFRRLNDGGGGQRLKEKLLAYWRTVMYRRISGPLGESVDLSFGQLTLLSMATIFIAILPFYQGYFLRSMFRFGSPPLSVRCAMLISALLPISIALAGKVNLVSILTGISYAKLNIWHRYVTFAMYALAVVHLVPHFISPVREGGTKELKELIVDKHRELSGIVLHFTFTMIVLFSIPWFRNRCYEAFKIVHIVFGVCFFCFLFWHIQGEYLTPDFFWAAVAIFFGNFLARAVYRNRMPISFKEFVKGFPTSLEVLPGKMTRVVIQCPQQLRWSPGQHCYISIPGISKIQSHPFTIASLSQHLATAGPNDMVILMRACKGFTKLVGDLALKNAPRSGSVSSSTCWSDITEVPEEVKITTRAWIDGPYGDFHPALELQYHGVFCIAGGSGITSALPWLVYLSSKMRLGSHGRKGARGEKICKTRNLHLIWSVRNLSWIRWAERELSEALRHAMMANAPVPQSRPQSPKQVKLLGYENGHTDMESRTAWKLKISIYVTQKVEDGEMKAAMLDLYLGAGVDVYNPHANVQVFRGRPDYSTVLPNMIDRKRNMLLTCGPQSQKIAVANTVANLQSLVIDNKAMEIALHSETFGW